MYLIRVSIINDYLVNVPKLGNIPPFWRKSEAMAVWAGTRDKSTSTNSLNCHMF